MAPLVHVDKSSAQSPVVLVEEVEAGGAYSLEGDRNTA